MSHDFSSGITTALSIGYDLQSYTVSLRPLAPGQSLIRKIKDCHSRWTHPLLLPSLFLVDHAQRVHNYINNLLSERVVLVEHLVGVTQTGRSQQPHLDFRNSEHAGDANSLKLFEGQRLQRENARKLVEKINDLSTQILFSKRSPEWNIGCNKFVLQLLEGSTRLANCRSIPARSFKEVLEFVRAYSEASAEVIQTNQDRVSLQLDIVSSVLP